MKTLANHTLIYDEDCPLCQAYTSTFVKTGMLDSDGRKSYSVTVTKAPEYLDIERAKNEIALVDTDRRIVTYGIDSLLTVIGHSFPLIKKIGFLSPVHYLLKKLYSFISYNRKVIIPARVSETTAGCEPAFNYRYRIAYILTATLLTSLILYTYSRHVPMPQGGYVREFLLAAGQIVFQLIFMMKQGRERAVNYIGNLMTVSFCGSLLLLPILIINKFAQLPNDVFLGWFLVVATLMFIEHRRRVKLLAMPGILTYSWILYRFLFLILLFL